jgi:uncharacterized lipoprotein YbaY
MKSLAPLLLAALCLIATTPGCQQLDVTPEGDPQRILTGTVNLAGESLLPPNTEVVVRIVQNSTVEHAAKGDLPIAAASAAREMPERVLAEQVIRAPGVQPVPFQLEYRADDATLRHGLNVDVRVSFAGKVRYRTLNAHLLTLSSAPFPHTVWVQAVQ